MIVTILFVSASYNLTIDGQIANETIAVLFI